jgi:release factor glutamine methyltransferase
MSIAEALRAATQRLADTSDTARLDAEVLMAHALGVPRSDMLLRHMRDPVPAGFAVLVERRAAHEPVAYITGTQEFYGLDLVVTPDVLIPRGDSETLIEAAQELFAGREPPGRIIDLGTGSGALLLAALSLWPGASGCAVDVSPAVASALLPNIRRHGAGHAIEFKRADWRQAGWAVELGQFDLILCNPPYVEDSADLDSSVRDYEPANALFSGPEGLDDYRILIPQLPGLLAEKGVAVFEIGHRQAEAVVRIAAEAGLAASVRQDLGGRDRAIILQKMH